jgi:hypothetical protein
MSVRAVPEPRLRRRRKLLLASAPVVLVAVVVAVKLLSMPVSASQAAAAYEGGNADGTVRAGQAMGVMNMVERYKAHFSLGDGYVLRGDFDAARTEFSRALELVPGGESCKVRVNLVLSLEKLGEARDKAGDPASAAELFAQGGVIIAEAPRDCFTANSENNKDGEGQALSEAKERLAQKQQDGKGDGEDQPADSGTSSPAEEPPASKLEQLEKSGQQAQKERSKSEKLGEDYADTEPEQFAKPW